MDLYAFKKGIGFSHFAYSKCAEEVKLVSCFEYSSYDMTKGNYNPFNLDL